MNNVFGRLGAVVVLGILASACGGGDEAAKPPVTPTPPPPVASVDTTPAPAMTAAAPAKPTLAELQATALKTILDGENAHDTAKIGAAYTDDATVTVAGVPPTTNKADMAAMLQHHFDTFKNATFWATRTFTKNDMVAVEWGWAGVDTGGMMGKPATEKTAGSMGLSLYWFTPEGLVKKEDRYLDFGTTMAQLSTAKHLPPVPALSISGGAVQAHVAKGTPDEDKAVTVATAMYAALDAKKQDDFLATIDDAGDFVDNAGPMAGQTTKKADAKKFFGMWTKAFPDQKNTITNSYGIEDYVVVESSMTGTQKGAIGPIAASKKPVTLHSAEIYQIANGKMIHGWSYSNGAELMMQTGAMKMPSDKAPAGDMGKAAGASKGAAAKTPTTPATTK